MARKFFNLSEGYARWRDYRVNPLDRGLQAFGSSRARSYA